MPRIKFSFETLAELDSGKIDLAIKRELRRIADDLNDRPGDRSARKLTVEVTFRPATEESGVCETTDVSFKVVSKVPPRTSRDYNMEVRGNGEMIFNPASDNDAKQTSLDEQASPHKR